MRVGFIGLGNQGAPMARRIAGRHELRVWARRPASLEALQGAPSAVAATPAALAADSDVVCVCVRDDADVAELLRGDDGLLAAMRPGSCLVLHSTVHPDTPPALAGAAPPGVDVLDAPVSGGAAAADAGTLVTIVGGRTEVLDRVRPVLDAHSAQVFHVGDLGAGQVAKLVNNTVFTANLAVTSTAIAVGTRLGLDADVLRAVLQAGSGASFAGRAEPAFGSLPFGGQGAALLTKDVGLLVDVTDTAGVDLGALGIARAALAGELGTSFRSGEAGFS